MNKELLKRTFFGLLFSATIILGVLYCKEAFFAVFLLLLVLAQSEFYKITKLAGATPLKWLGIITGVSLFAAGFMYSFFNDSYWIYLFILELFIVLIWETFRSSATPLLNISALFAGICYVALPLTIIQYLFFAEYNPFLVLSIFFIIWMNDSAAYVFGSMLGRTKFAPKISPKKTWEGAIAGLICSVILVFFLPNSYLPFATIDRFFLTVCIVVFSTLGDLFQSKLKRSVNLKDSGDILPGHGGILDRIDSMLFAFPAAFIYLGILGYQTF